MNLMRPITVAPMVTVCVKDLTKMGSEFIAEHALAGNAIIRRCTHTPINSTHPREYWTIETSFRGDDPVEPVRAHNLRWTEHTDWMTLDEALCGLSILGVLWAAEHPVAAYQTVLSEVH